MGCACGWVGICGSDFGESFVFDENGTRRRRGASSLSCVVCSARVEEGKKRVARF